MRMTMVNDIMSHSLSVSDANVDQTSLQVARPCENAAVSVLDDSFDLPDILLEHYEPKLCVVCLQTTLHSYIVATQDSICLDCVQRKKIQDRRLSIEAEAIQKLSRYKHDPRECEVFTLYRFINDSILSNTLPLEPSEVLAVVIAPENDSKFYGITYYTDYHPRRFEYVLISGTLCWSYELLLSTLAHELVHVIVGKRLQRRCGHGKKFHEHGIPFLEKLKLLSHQLPRPFTGLEVDVKDIIKAGKEIEEKPLTFEMTHDN